MSNELNTTWIKASRSNTDGSCVEMRRAAGVIQVRDTKDLGQGSILSIDLPGFRAWLQGAKQGEFDQLS